MDLRGTALEKTTGSTLGGATVGANGDFAPDPVSPLDVSGHVVTVNVPPASATLVRVK